MEGIAETAFRTILGLVYMLLFTKILGKKQLGELTFFNYATGIAFGNIVGEMIIHFRDVPVSNGLVAVAIWVAAILLIEFIVKRSPKAKLVLESEPSIVIKKGMIMQESLNKLNLGMDDLCMLLRNKDVFSITEVEYAIFEPNGKLSLKKNNAAKTVRPSLYLPSELIVSGVVMHGNLKEYGLKEQWLLNKLEKAGISGSHSVFFAQLQEDGSLYVAKNDGEKPLIL